MPKTSHWGSHRYSSRPGSASSSAHLSPRPLTALSGGSSSAPSSSWRCWKSKTGKREEGKGKSETTTGRGKREKGRVRHSGARCDALVMRLWRDHSKLVPCLDDSIRSKHGLRPRKS